MIPVPDIEILFEDDVLVAVNKPALLPVHATADSGTADLQSLFEARYGRPLILFHRLDRETSGIVLLGKSRRIAKAMHSCFTDHRIRKAYWAVVRGQWQSEWNRMDCHLEKGQGGHYRVVKPPAGKRAISTVHVRGRHPEKTWIEVLPKTGRTHQIRVQCAFQGCPILGDRRYGSCDAGMPPMALHAVRVDLAHPLTQAPLSIVAKPPSYWAETWLKGFEGV